MYLCSGVFVYALDDPYIHMTMADNLVNHGKWAVNQMNFSSASSSPMWVLVISAVYAALGKNLVTPFILNLLFQVMIIAIVCFKFREYGISKYKIPLLLLFIYVTAMPAILFTGMEHSAQIAFALLFVYYGIKLIISSNSLKYLIFITPVLTALRYEDMILVLLVSVLLFAKRKPLYGIIILLLGALPIVVYGLISVSNGWLFFPNTLLLKSTPPGFSPVDIIRYGFKAFTNITEPHLFLLLILSSFLFVFNFKRQKNFWDEKQLFLLIASAAIIINMSVIEYHQNGAFYRYEAYLMALGLFAVIIAFYDFIPDFKNLLFNKIGMTGKYAVIILLLIILSPFVLRFFTAFGIPHASLEYYSQQYQMAQFVKQYAKGMNVALNDIGMVSYYSDNKVVDLWGVANIDVIKHKLNRDYTTKAIEELTIKENIRFAVIYENWFEQYGGFPVSWKKLATWTMTSYNFFLGHDTVTLYCINPNDEKYLKEKIDEYSLTLPKSVIYKIY